MYSANRDSFSKAPFRTDKDLKKWKSKVVTNAVAAAVAKRIKSVDLQDPDVVIFVVVLGHVTITALLLARIRLHSAWIVARCKD